jgi:hypothetical protein
MSADEDGVHMVDEPTEEALEPISSHPRSLPSPPPAPPAPPAPSRRKQYRMTRAAAVAVAAAAAAAVEQSLASVVWQAAEGDSTIDEPYYKVADSGVLTQSNFEGEGEGGRERERGRKSRRRKRRKMVCLKCQNHITNAFINLSQ